MVVPTPRSKSTARGRAAGVYAAAPTAMPAPGSSEHERVIHVLRQAILLAPGMIARPYHMAQPLWMALRDLLPLRSLKHFLLDNSDTFKIVKTEDGNSTWGFIFSSSAEPPRPPPPLRPAPVGAAGVSAAAPATALPAEEPPTATQRKVATEAATMDARAQAAQCPWPSVMSPAPSQPPPSSRPQPPVMSPAPAGAAGVSAAAPGFGTALKRHYDGSGMHTLSFPDSESASVQAVKARRLAAAAEPGWEAMPGSSEGGGWGHSGCDHRDWQGWGGWGPGGWDQGWWHGRGGWSG